MGNVGNAVPLAFNRCLQAPFELLEEDAALAAEPLEGGLHIIR
jgi:hypothetical protein